MDSLGNRNGSLLGTVQEAYELLLSSREGESKAAANGFLEYWVIDGERGRKKAVTEPRSLMPITIEYMGEVLFSRKIVERPTIVLVGVRVSRHSCA